MHHPPNNHDADAGVHSNVSNFPSQITDHHHRYYANQAMKVVSSFHSGKHDSNGSSTNASNNNSTAATASFSSNSSSNDSRSNISNSNMEYGRSSFRVRAILSPNGNNVECVDYDANKNNDGRSSTTSSSTSYSSSSSHRDHRHHDHHHHVTFRDEKKRVPKSVNATTLLVSLSKSSSTLSREEYVVGGSSFGGGPAIINHHHHHGGDDNSKNSVTSSYGYGASDNESSHTSMSNFDLVSNPVNFTVCHSNEQDTYNNHDNNNITHHNLATSSMFTKEDLDAITPLQISTYLTLKQRETIGTKVLCAKLKKRRYSVIDGGRTVCRVCCMPRLGRWSGEKSKSSSSSSSSSSNELEAIECPICPVLKKRVLEKILDGCM